MIQNNDKDGVDIVTSGLVQFVDPQNVFLNNNASGGFGVDVRCNLRGMIHGNVPQLPSTGTKQIDASCIAPAGIF